MQGFHEELYKTVGVFALARYYLYIDIDKKFMAILSSHPEKSDKK